MNNPLFSVVIPAHNTAEYLPLCVQDLLSQGDDRLEIILVDDSSTDGTGEVCEELAAKDARVRVLHMQFRDVSLTRNAGLDIARGDYVGFSDSDDRLSPDLLSLMESIIREHHPDLIRYGMQEVSDSGSTRDLILPYPEGLYDEALLRENRLDAIFPANVLDYSIPRNLSASAHFFRREFLETNHLRFRSQKEILSEDYLFILNALFLAESVYHLPRALYFYIARSGSLSRAPKPRMMERKKLLMKAYLRFLPMDDPEVSVRLRNFYIDSVYDCFVNACLQCSTRKDAMSRIRVLLNDPVLSDCLNANRQRIVSVKAKCICFLMQHHMAGCMYAMYRLLTRF